MASKKAYLDGIRKATEKYARKEKHRVARPHRHSPEKVLEKEIMAYLISIGASVDVVEASNYGTDFWKRPAIRAGFSDIVGNLQGGRALYLELKAPGRRNTLKDHQREFLIEKIKSGAFAACVDSVKLLSELVNGPASFDDLLANMP